MPKPGEEKKLPTNADDIAAQMDAEDAEAGAADDDAAEGEDGDQEDDQDGSGDEGAEGEGEEAEADDSEAEGDEDGDDPYAGKFEGETVPKAAFLAAKAKAKERAAKQETEIRARIEAEFKERLSTGMGAEEAKKYKSLTSVFGNLDKSVHDKPWLREVLLSLGKGEEPDWRKASQALADYAKAIPSADPLILQQIREQKMQLDQIQQDRFDSTIASHVQAEDLKIKEVIGEDPDLMALINEVAQKAVPEQGSIKDLPDRVAIAKRVKAWFAKSHAAELKKQVVKPGDRQRKDLGSGSGAAGGTKLVKKAPAVDSDKFADWLNGDDEAATA